MIKRNPSILSLSLCMIPLVIALTATVGFGQPNPLYDTDRDLWLEDTDGDTFPNFTEELEGTNPNNPEDYPGADLPESENNEQALQANVGFPRSTCRSGYRQAGSRLCISPDEENARTFANAATFCRDRRGRVCSYTDLRYLYVRTGLDASYNPSGNWIGNFTGDDQALCGNRSITFNNDPDIGNFEGTCNRFNSRSFWCCHDDE